MIVLVPDPKADATSEKGLLQIVFKSIGVTGHPIEYIPPLLLALLAIPSALFCELQLSNIARAGRMAKMLVTWAALGDTVAVTILGFLVAGFAIFSAVSDKLLFLKLASYKSEGRNISQFKFIFFTFMYVFALYMIMIAASSFLAVAAEENSPIWYIGKLLSKRFPAQVREALIIVICLYLALFLHCILILRGFIWNMYSSVVIATFSDKEVADELRRQREAAAQQ
jgi:hypothetical protein